MVETTTTRKIRRLAARRQALWLKAPALTVAEKGELGRLTAALDALWERHRTELAGPQTAAGVRRPSRNGSSPRRRSAA